MANTIVKVPMATVPWGDDKIERPLAAAAAIYYPGSMIALDASGNAVKCDNTAGIRFDGIQADTPRIQVFSGDAAGDRVIKVERPWRFTMKIAAAVAGDEGKALYARFDDEVSYSQTNSIFVGWVDQVLSATNVLVRPAWSGQAVGGILGFDGETLTFAGATTVNQIIMPDNLADSLSIQEGSNKYITFVTTNSAELINVLKTMQFGGTTGNNIVNLVDNLADALNIKQGANSYLKFVTTDSSEAVVIGKAATGVSLAVTAGLTSSGATGAGIGYATGAGGTASQATDRTTGVTVDKLSGAITTQATSLAAGAEVSFTVTNSTVAVGDTVIACIRSGPTTLGSTQVSVTTVAAGSFQLTLNNFHASVADTGAAIINFVVFKAVSA